MIPTGRIRVVKNNQLTVVDDVATFLYEDYAPKEYRTELKVNLIEPSYRQEESIYKY